MNKIIKNPFERKHKGTLFALCCVCVLLAGCFYSCKKDDDIDMSKIDFSNIEDLYAQPLPVIQKCVQGKWQVKGTYGGIAGWNPAPDNVFVEINDNKLNDRKFQWKKYTVKKPDGDSYKTYAIYSVEFDEPSMYFGSIKNDSLAVLYPNMDCCDRITGALWIRSK